MLRRPLLERLRLTPENLALHEEQRRESARQIVATCAGQLRSRAYVDTWPALKRTGLELCKRWRLPVPRELMEE